MERSSHPSHRNTKKGRVVLTPEPDEAFFEPTLTYVQAHHASVLARSKRLNDAPLQTSKFRDAERAEKERSKADRWPNVSCPTAKARVLLHINPIGSTMARFRSRHGCDLRSRGGDACRPFEEKLTIDDDTNQVFRRDSG